MRYYKMMSVGRLGLAALLAVSLQGFAHAKSTKAELPKKAESASTRQDSELKAKREEARKARAERRAAEGALQVERSPKEVLLQRAQQTPDTRVRLRGQKLKLQDAGRRFSKPNGTFHDGRIRPAGLNNPNSFINGLIPGSTDQIAISQIEDNQRNSIVITVNDRGTMVVWVYLNSYLGYVSPLTGDMLYCAPYEIPDRFLEVPLQDCERTGSNVSQFRSFIDTYPTTGRYINKGGELYYDNGNLMRDFSGTWYYDNGIDELYDSFLGIWRYASFQRIRDTFNLDVNYPDGGRLYSDLWNELRYRGQEFFADAAFSAVYPDGIFDMMEVFGSTRYLSYPPSFFSIADLSRLTNHLLSSQLVTIKYPANTTLKVDSFPYLGDLFNEAGFSQVLVTRAYPIAADSDVTGGKVEIDADTTSDYIGIYQYQDDVVTLVAHALMQVREGSALPQNPGSVTMTPTSNSMLVSWTAAPAPTTSYRVAHSIGTTVPPANCAGGLQVNTTSTTLSALPPDTNIAVRVCGTNGVSDSIGVTRTAKTLKAPATPIITVGVISTRTIRLNLSPGSGGGVTTGYIIAHQEGFVSPASCAGGTTVGNVNGYTIPNLKGNTYYSYSVCAVDTYGTQSAFMATGFASTNSDIPYTPITFNIWATTDTTVGVAWDTLSNTTPIEHLPVTYRVAITSVSPQNPGAQPPANCSPGFDAQALKVMTIQNLNPNTKYRVRVCAVSSASEVSLNNPVLEFTTFPSNAVPFAITEIKKLSGGEKQLTFRAPRQRRIYVFQYKNDLNTTDWTTVPSSERRSDQDGQLLIWIDTQPSPTGMRYYRVVQTGVF